jgi:hypothetical protein
VYVDNDPLVLAHARALLTSSPEGRTAYIHADLRNPDAILEHQATSDILDLSQPTALILVGILHFIQDEDKPAGIVSTLMDALPPGSYLAASHITTDHDPDRVGASERTSRGLASPRNFATATRSPDSRSRVSNSFPRAWSRCRNGGRNRRGHGPRRPK